MPDDIIEVRDLCKVYSGGVRAVDGVSFDVHAGEIFGFLGPNGAGKSTTIAILTTIIQPTGGTARVAGIDVVRHPYEARCVMGYVSQDLGVDDDLTGYQNLRLQAGFYHLPAAEAERRIARVLDMVNLTDRAKNRVETYSGGMRKRLDIASGLIHEPRLLFLDEPTLGLDIQTRHEIWRYITELRARIGMTVFLSTHYMDEADELCDRIAIIDYGQIKALDTPANLKRALGGDMVEFRFDRGTPEAVGRATAAIRALDCVTGVVPVQDDAYQATVCEGESVVPRIFEAVAGLPVRIGGIALKRPTLDDVFLHYTGRALRETGGGGAEAFTARLRMRRTRG